MYRFLLYITALLLVSCSKYDPYLCTVSDITLRNANDSGTGPVLDSINPIPAKSYAIQIQYTMSITGREGHVTDESGYALQYKLTTFNLTSTTDFDNDHAAGASLNDLFLYGYAYDNSVRLSSQATVINGVTGQHLFYGRPPSGVDINKPWTSNFQLFLMKSPVLLGPRTFLLETAFSNNTHFTDTLSVTLR
ncbi:MAG: hypothetical protein JST68_12665 [Bacteroidetes bacterium]|nr:hypothetical protein [Bacteroidota bacterium]